MEIIIKMYLDYVDKFLTIERFSKWYWLDEDDSKIIINMWMKYNDRKEYKNIKE